MDTDLIAEFAAFQRAKHLADTTIRNRDAILRQLSRHLGKPLDEATIGDLRRFLGREGVKPGTVRTERNAIRTFYAFLLEDEYIAADPSQKLARVVVPKAEPRPFTKEQIDRMLDSGAYAKTRAMILVGYYQGFRVSSIAAVHGADIDLSGLRPDGYGGTIRTVGKGGKVRRLPLHPVIAELSHSMPKDAYWFPARGGRTGHMHPTSVTDQITDAKRRAGITDPQLTPHSLRHAFGTDMVEEGVDIRVIAELMMHESVATTQIYTRVSERLKREAIATLAPRPVPRRSGRAVTA